MAYAYVYDYKREGFYFNLFLGGRGCGKTYGALLGAYDDYLTHGKKFYFLRRTDEERKLAELFNPFSKINQDHNTHVLTAPIGKKVTGFYIGEIGDEGDWVPGGEPIGYMLSLSTMGSVRGLGLDDGKVDKLIYDEFIPEPHVRLLKMEGDAFFNAYETLNRNRELEGKDPIYCYLLANANKIDNPIFKSMGLVSRAERMVRRKEKDLWIPERGLALHFLQDAEFTRDKKKGVLARLTEGSDYATMAYDNDFAYNDFTSIRRLDLKGMTPWIAVGDAHVWRQKGGPKFYASYHDGSFAYRYAADSQPDKMLAKGRHAGTFRRAYAEGLITFESFELKSRLLDFFDVK